MTDDGSRLDRIEALQERTQQQVDENSRQIEETSRNLDRVVGAIEALYQLNQAQGELYQTQRAEFVEFQRTTQAALDRIDRILDYLMRRDGEPQG